MAFDMKTFVDRCEDRIHGVLSCFDRMLFRGYLPIIPGWSMARLLRARKIAERDGIEQGLVCVFSALEPCRTFSLRFTTGQPYVQTWFPLQVQVCLSGHEWL